MKSDKSENGEKIRKMELNGKKCSETNSVEGDSLFCCKSKRGPIDGKKKKIKLTCNQKMSLVMLALADFMSVCSMSIISPFYPAESSKKNVPQSVSGLVFGAYALVVFLTSPVFGNVIPKFGAKLIFITGLFVSGISSIIFGLIDRLDNYALFVAASVTIRSFEALGASAYCTAGYVLIVNIFPENTGAVRGLLETFVGLGLSAGPGIGGLLYAVGGFGLPFYVVGTVCIIIAFLNIYLLVQPEKNDVEKSGSLTNLLKLPPVLVTCIIIMLSSMTGSYLDPTLEPHLRKFNLSASQVGFLFLLLSATYGICSPIWGWMTDRIDNYTWLMTTGLFGASVVLMFLGPSPIFTFLQDSIWLNAVALAMLGVFQAMSLIPTYQFMLDSAIDNGFQDCLGTHSVIAGLWSSVYSLGEVIGPVLGGTLMENFQFPVTSTTFAFLNFLGVLIAMASFKLGDMKKKDSPKKEGIDNDICYIESRIDLSVGQISKKRINDDNMICSRL